MDVFGVAVGLVHPLRTFRSLRADDNRFESIGNLQLFSFRQNSGCLQCESMCLARGSLFLKQLPSKPNERCQWSNTGSSGSRKRPDHIFT